MGLERYAGRAVGVMFAIALIDAALIGAAAVSLSTAYAIGDVFSASHSLHRKVSDAKGFYAVYACLIAIAAVIVLTPGAPLGLLTVAVQTLAGVLLPSATVFLLLLCNDRAVLGPWVNGRWVNALTGAVIAALVALSMILTVSVLFPEWADERTIVGILAGAAAAAAAAFALAAFRPNTADCGCRRTERLRPGRLADATPPQVAPGETVPPREGLDGDPASIPRRRRRSGAGAHRVARDRQRMRPRRDAPSSGLPAAGDRRLEPAFPSLAPV